jgi:citronellol/citronellal dehydrogenase
LPGTIHETVAAVNEAGGTGLAVEMDVRDGDQVAEAVRVAVEWFGGIDALVNNASAIHVAQIEETPEKRFDLMFDINLRGTYLCSRTCIPHLKRGTNPHILTLAPPLALQRRWFAPHTMYTVSKYAMALTALGLAAELAPAGVASNALWPATLIGTSALELAQAGPAESSRTPEIMADAAFAILTRPSRECTGRCFLDEEVLREVGVTDFTSYATSPGVAPIPDLFVSPGDLSAVSRLGE